MSSRSRCVATAVEEDEEDANILEFEEQWASAEGGLSATFREWRHNHCLMRPASAALIAVVLLGFGLTLLLNFPSFLLGVLITGPARRRFNWLVEFLYPTSLGRWGHLLLMRFGQKSDSSSGGGAGTAADGHSFCLPQRSEVVPNRVFVHPIPMFMDNVAWLITFAPPPDERDRRVPVLALLVDCGDANAALGAVEEVRRHIYHNRPLEVRAVLSTHKHHDHTAGNRAFRKKHAACARVYGGAIERVPGCDSPLENGDRVAIPFAPGNDPRSLVSVEAVAVPSHTRGSVVYVLRPQTKDKEEEKSACSHAFTGDAMFSGGGGLPFEADLDKGQETLAKVEKRKPRDPVRPSAGLYSVERCFAEILLRTSPAHRVMVYPGHDYTAELLARQFSPEAALQSKASDWNKMPPSVFFRAASHFLLAQHRRSLPKGARLLTVPTTLRRELDVNPHFRNLHQRARVLLTALHVWHKHLSRTKLERYEGNNPNTNNYHPPLTSSTNATDTTTSSSSVWTVTHEHATDPAFSTVYSADLRELVEDLRRGDISPAAAANLLDDLPRRLERPVVSRRPIPNSLPPGRTMWIGTLALALLGTPPTAATKSDAERMRLPPPPRNSDRLVVSRRRLVVVLRRLGLLRSDGGRCVETELLTALWRECAPRQDDASAANEPPDAVPLGLLKAELYGVVRGRVPRWCSRFVCSPCSPFACTKNDKARMDMSPELRPDERRRRNLATLRRTNGELLRHDAETCPLCRGTTGCCPHAAAALYEEGEEAAFRMSESESTDEEENVRSNGLCSKVNTSVHEADLEVVILSGNDGRGSDSEF